MKNQILKEEKVILDSKAITINTVPPPLKAWAGKDGKSIFVSENIKHDFGEVGYTHIIHHERDHLNSLNRVFWFLSYFFLIILLLFSIPNILQKNLSISFLLIAGGIFLFILFTYFNEILADKYATFKFKDSYLGTIKMVYAHTEYLGNKKWSYRNIYHPPQKLRFYFIERFSH